jgi:4,5-DOPA dioxygenase extradiol
MNFQRQPALFFGHGNPMNALAENRFTRAWRAEGERWRARPRAQQARGILVISAHHLSREVEVVSLPELPKINDFYGFPASLSRSAYQAWGDELAADEVAKTLQARITTNWGLDHGAWSVLMHAWPKPQPGSPIIIPISLPVPSNDTQLESVAQRLGEGLSKLRDLGWLVLASGNLVHNLHEVDMSGDLSERDGLASQSPRGEASSVGWAEKFEQEILHRILNWKPGMRLLSLIPEGLQRAHPTAEHLWPLFPILASVRQDEEARVLIRGIQNASISMATLSWSAPSSGKLDSV